MKKSRLICFLCLCLAGCSKVEKAEQSNNKVENSGTTIIVRDDTKEIVIKGNNTQVSTEDSNNNSNE